MRKTMLVSVVVLLALGLCACGGKSEEPAPAPAAPPAATPPAPPAATPPAPPALPAAAAAAAPVADVSDPIHQKLIGTAWTVGDFEIAFQDAAGILLKGGPLKDIAPNGLKGQYTYKDGAVTITAMGQSKTGTWDGEKLVIDGKDGFKK